MPRHLKAIAASPCNPIPHWARAGWIEGISNQHVWGGAEHTCPVASEYAGTGASCVHAIRALWD
eukprot:1697329-Alexandrium_andersonii.AAC.1